MQQLPFLRSAVPWWRLCVSAAALALVACGGGEESGTTEKAIRPPSVTGTVEIATAQKPFLTIESVGNSSEGSVLTLPARVAFRSQAQSAIGATVAGRVVALLVRAGEPVKAGAPLFTIESPDAAATRATLDVFGDAPCHR